MLWADSGGWGPLDRRTFSRAYRANKMVAMFSHRDSFSADSSVDVLRLFVEKLRKWGEKMKTHHQRAEVPWLFPPAPEE